MSSSDAVKEHTRPKDKSKYLYIAVIVAVLGGITLGLVSPETGKSLKPLGTLFVDLIKMMIAPVIFCTIVLGIGSIRKAGTVGRAGLLALVYFIVMSTFALIIGLVVGNMIKPGEGITITPGGGDKYAEEAEGASEGLFGFLGSVIPDTLFSSVTQGPVLPALLVALLAGFAVQKLEPAQSAKALDAISILQKVVFRILTMILWLAPIGAFGAMAAVVGESGASAVGELLKLMFGFYLTCVVFIFGILGLVLKLITGVNIFKLLKYLAREFLLIVATSSSESALPNLMAKMTHAGVNRSTVGIVVPTGYSFNLDGTAIYLTMASIFIADAMNMPMSFGEQIGLLAFMIIASKGAAGVTGAGLTTLAGGLASHRPEMVDGVGVIVGIDRFMSEARALTNFAGNAVATLVIGRFTSSVDFAQVERTLSGADPFDYATLSDDAHGAEESGEPSNKELALEHEHARGGADGRRSTDD